ncbi:MAG: TIGR03545 family protein [Aeoliella sp.]
MRFLRFSYVIPRVILIIVILLATEFGSGYLVRWGLVAGGEASVGAKVEIGGVTTSLLRTRLHINAVAVANPNSPMKNLLEADRVEIDFSSSALLRKKLIADYGIVSGLKFSTPRETSGELAERATSMDDDSPQQEWLTPLAKDHAEKWLNDLESRFSTDIHDQFQSVRLAEDMAQQWPTKYRELEAAAREIKVDAKKLEGQVREARANPLRNVEFLAQLPQETASLRRALRDLQADLALLPAEIAADREAILAARSQDEQLIRENLRLESIDSQSLTNYLLGEQITEPVGEAIAWVRWARRLVPPRGTKQLAVSGRGENIIFASSKPIPNVLIRALRLEGSARMGGQPVQLVGVVRDWTTQPDLHGKPTTLEFNTTGGVPLSVQARLDRTTNVPYDEFIIDSRGLVLPKLELGNQGPLRLAVSPSTADVSIQLQLEGDQLTGDIRIAQQGLTIEPNLSSNLLEGRLQSALAENVSRIDQSHTHVKIAGTLNSPRMEFSSTLGAALAEAVQRSATDVARAEGDRLVARGQQEVDAQIAKFTGECEKFQSQLTDELAAPGEIIANLLGQKGGDNQLGRSPFGQLFK